MAAAPIEFVVDSSVALKWVLAEPDSNAALVVRSHVLAAPEILLVECANILWTKVRASQLDLEAAGRYYSAINVVPFELAADADLAFPAFTLALELNHPAYDCLYIALAQRLGVPLVTADRRLVAALRKRPAPPCIVRTLDELG